MVGIRQVVIRALTVGLVSLLGSIALSVTAAPLKLVVPFTAGGPVDVTARALSEALTPTLGRVLVENRPGAGGAIGVEAALRRPANGETLILGAVGTLAIGPHLHPTRWDTEKDLTPVAGLVTVPNVLLVTPEWLKQHAITNFDGWLDYVKAHSQTLNGASGGVGSGGHLALLALNRAENLAITHVAYKGAAQARLSVLAGHTDFIFDNWASARALVASGDLVPLAVTGKARLAALPNLPTLTEKGLPIEVTTWWGVFVKAGTPEGLVQKSQADIKAAMASDTFKARTQSLGEGVGFKDASWLENTLYADRRRYGVMLKGTP